MNQVIIGQNFFDFLFFIGFPILATKILSLGFQKFIPHQKLEDFFVFIIVSIIEIIISSIWLFKTLKITNVELVLSVIIWIILINTLNLIKMYGYSRKNGKNWGDFISISFISIIFFIILMSFIKFKWF